MKCFGCGRDVGDTATCPKGLDGEMYCTKECHDKFSSTPVTVDFTAGALIIGTSVKTEGRTTEIAAIRQDPLKVKSQEPKKQNVSWGTHKLPGKYAFWQKVGSYEETITFQTHEELMAFVASERAGQKSGEIDPVSTLVHYHPGVSLDNGKFKCGAPGHRSCTTDPNSVTCQVCQDQIPRRCDFTLNEMRCDEDSGHLCVHSFKDGSVASIGCLRTKGCHHNAGHGGECS